ncbi:MAG TPA: chemotaxis protein CheB, partial [Chryseolinea sp.]|nr:chemotaxis protein CheB [Chryseolinea sp.]
MNNDFFIVGIGASAGGEACLYDFFSNMPLNVNASFIVIRHLKRDFQSQMKFLLSRHTQLPIYTIRNGEEIKPHAIYLMPENTTTRVKDNHLILKGRPAHDNVNHAIDEFLVSLAHEVKEKAIGIILSGMGTDGTNGANAIEEHGGIVMVQDPKSAKFDSMPNSVIANDFPDYILHAKDMGRHLSEYIQLRAQ